MEVSRIKKLVAMVMAVVIALTSMSFSAFATDGEESLLAADDKSSSFSTGGETTPQPIVTIEEQLREIENNPNISDERRARDIEKLTDNSPPKLSRATAKTLNVPFRKQENDYYCGPATVQQTLWFLLNLNGGYSHRIRKVSRF